LDDVNKAVEEKLKGHKIYKDISEEFGVPQSDIFNRIKGRYTSMCTKSARRPVLDLNVERRWGTHVIRRNLNL